MQAQRTNIDQSVWAEIATNADMLLTNRVLYRCIVGPVSILSTPACLCSHFVTRTVGGHSQVDNITILYKVHSWTIYHIYTIVTSWKNLMWPSKVLAFLKEVWQILQWCRYSQSKSGTCIKTNIILMDKEFCCCNIEQSGCQRLLCVRQWTLLPQRWLMLQDLPRHLKVLSKLLTNHSVTTK